MPVLRSIRERFARERPLDGRRRRRLPARHVGDGDTWCARCRRAAPTVALCASNPLSTQDDVAAALARRGARCTRAGRTRGPTASPRWSRGRRRSRSTTAPTCWARCTPRGPTCWTAMLGGTEETTTGLVRLRALEAEGGSRCPVLAVNEARAERAFNDRFGTGQSMLDGILRATNLLLAGQTVVVLGYGWTGRGVALRAHGLGRVGDRLRGRPAARAGGADGGLRGDAGARGGRARRRLHHGHRRAATCCAASTSSA